MPIKDIEYEFRAFIYEGYLTALSPQKYYEANEVEGALINFLLAYNIITTVKKFAPAREQSIESQGAACHSLDGRIDEAENKLQEQINKPLFVFVNHIPVVILILFSELHLCSYVSKCAE